jgi:hypothetical protein
MRDERRCLSPEDIAALADGRLSGRQRREMAAHLDVCRDCYDLFVDTVRFRSEADTAPDSTGNIASFPGTRRWPRVFAALAAAAALLLAVGILLRQPPAGPEAPAGPGVSRTGPATPARPPDSSLPPRETTPPQTVENPVPRSFYTVQLDRLTGGELTGAPGLAFAEPLAREEYGFAGSVTGTRLPLRLGVRLMDLAVAGRTGDRDGLPRLRSEVKRLAAAAGMADLSPDPAAAVQQLPDRLEAKADSLCRLGFWAEGGRLAAKARRAGYFDADTSRAFCRTAHDAGLPTGVTTALERIGDSLTAGLGDDTDWKRLERDFTSLVLMF